MVLQRQNRQVIQEEELKEEKHMREGKRKKIRREIKIGKQPLCCHLCVGNKGVQGTWRRNTGE